MIYVVRLKENTDLKQAIEAHCLKNQLKFAYILSSVGSLKQLHIRLAKAIDKMKLNEDLEIISLNGTIVNGKAHLHIAASREDGSLVGGHLLNDCLIDTTCELVIASEDINVRRVFDENTGYDELEVLDEYNH